MPRNHKATCSSCRTKSLYASLSILACVDQSVRASGRTCLPSFLVLCLSFGRPGPVVLSTKRDRGHSTAVYCHLHYKENESPPFAETRSLFSVTITPQQLDAHKCETVCEKGSTLTYVMTSGGTYCGRGIETAADGILQAHFRLTVLQRISDSDRLTSHAHGD